MKTFLFAIMLLAGITGALQAAPTNDGSRLKITSTGDVFNVSYRGLKAGQVRIAIYDESGKRLLLDVFRNNGAFVRPYNFSELPAGEYRIELRDASGRFVERVSRTPDNAKPVATL